MEILIVLSSLLCHISELNGFSNMKKCRATLDFEKELMGFLDHCYLLIMVISCKLLFLTKDHKST